MVVNLGLLNIKPRRENIYSEPRLRFVSADDLRPIKTIPNPSKLTTTLTLSGQVIPRRSVAGMAKKAMNNPIAKAK